MQITKKEQLKPFTFYYWKEDFFKADKQGVKSLSDICFIYRIDKMSSSNNWQCNGIEIDSINSDLTPGFNYNYHYMWGSRTISTYIIKELSFDELTPSQKSLFWRLMFTENSSMNRSLDLAKKWGDF